MADDAPRVARIIEALERQYGEVKSFLAYRNPFELLVAVILSAQTTDRQVNLVTPELFERFPSCRDLAAAEVEDVETIIHSIGFFRTKARNLRATAKLLVERHGGSVPQSMEELIALPGVGRKSANVVRGTLFAMPAIIVDTHFGRVVRRLALTGEREPEKIERDIARKVEAADQMRFSMLVNNHGRVFCHARRPECPRCPIRSWCPYPDSQDAAG